MSDSILPNYCSAAICNKVKQLWVIDRKKDNIHIHHHNKTGGITFRTAHMHVFAHCLKFAIFIKEEFTISKTEHLILYLSRM